MLAQVGAHTLRAGALTPMAKVSVENNALITPRQNSISTISLGDGEQPGVVHAEAAPEELAHAEHLR